MITIIIFINNNENAPLSDFLLFIKWLKNLRNLICWKY